MFSFSAPDRKAVNVSCLLPILLFFTLDPVLSMSEEKLSISELNGNYFIVRHGSFLPARFLPNG